jgi:SHS2 domain-containing protein
MGAFPPRPYEFFEHTADLGLRASGRDLPDLFANAALGLMAAVVDPATVRPGGIRDRIRAEGPDRETLLVNWLNQVLFLFSVQRMVFCRFQVRSFSDTAIEAEGEGELLDPLRHGVLREVKAVTLHDLGVERAPDGTWRAKAILDV